MSRHSRTASGPLLPQLLLALVAGLAQAASLAWPGSGQPLWWLQLVSMARLQQDPAHGEAWLAEARPLWTKLVGDDHLFFVLMARQAAAFARMRGDLAASESALLDAEKRLQGGRNAMIAAVTQAELASLHAARGDSADARRRLAAALPVLRTSVLPTQLDRVDAEALARSLGR